MPEPTPDLTTSLPPAEMSPGSRNRALLAATLGFTLDAMDVLLYVFALQTLRAEFGLSNAEAGFVSSATLITSAAGGIGTGILSDRYGRKRLLMATILVYSVASAGTAMSRSFAELLFWRALVGIGLGGEWSAGATLVSESWPAAGRQKVIAFMQSGWAIGYMLAALVSGFILPRFGWRVLFLTGLLPALLTIFVRHGVEEPAVWRRRSGTGSFFDIFRPPLGGVTLRATALATATLLGYWGLFTWVPAFWRLPSPLAARAPAFPTRLPRYFSCRAELWRVISALAFWRSGLAGVLCLRGMFWPPLCWFRCTEIFRAGVAATFSYGLGHWWVLRERDISRFSGPIWPSFIQPPFVERVRGSLTILGVFCVPAPPGASEHWRTGMVSARH